MSVYEIRVKGCLDQHWATWFEGLTLSCDGDSTVLRGPLADEAALYGVLTKVGNLNLRLLSVNTIQTDGTAGRTSAADRGELVTPDRPISPTRPTNEAIMSESARQEQKAKAGTKRNPHPRRHGR